jgi:hypothetical protein
MTALFLRLAWQRALPALLALCSAPGMLGREPGTKCDF